MYILHVFLQVRASVFHRGHPREDFIFEQRRHAFLETPSNVSHTSFSEEFFFFCSNSLLKTQSCPFIIRTERGFASVKSLESQKRKEKKAEVYQTCRNVFSGIIWSKIRSIYLLVTSQFQVNNMRLIESHLCRYILIRKTLIIQLIGKPSK